jgi:hypothetical protein
MRPPVDPACMTPDERLREVAAILAVGLRRRRDRATLASVPAPEILADRAEKPLEAVPENPLSVHVG